MSDEKKKGTEEEGSATGSTSGSGTDRGDREMGPGSSHQGDGGSRESDLEVKYRNFFRELGKEGEAIELEELGHVVARSLAREGYDAQETGVGEVLHLVEKMVGTRGEGDSIVVRFRVHGRDIESFKVGR